MLLDLLLVVQLDGLLSIRPLVLLGALLDLQRVLRLDGLLSVLLGALLDLLLVVRLEGLLSVLPSVLLEALLEMPHTALLGTLLLIPYEFPHGDFLHYFVLTLYDIFHVFLSDALLFSAHRESRSEIHSYYTGTYAALHNAIPATADPRSGQCTSCHHVY